MGDHDGVDVLLKISNVNAIYGKNIMGDRFPDDYAAIRAYHAYATALQLRDEDDELICWGELTTFEKEAWVLAAKAAYRAEKHLLSDQ